MPTTEARIPTERASRYLVQLCRHANQLGRHRITRMPTHAGHSMPTGVTAEWSEVSGTISAGGARCTLRATEDALLLRAEADDEDALRRLQEMITRNLTRFSRREPLSVTWQGSDAAGPVEPEPAAAGTHRRTLILAGAGVLAVGAHVVLGAAVLAAPPWAGWTADAVLAVVLVKIVLVGLAYRRRSQHRRSMAGR
jgi:hypothetical protein